MGKRQKKTAEEESRSKRQIQRNVNKSPGYTLALILIIAAANQVFQHADAAAKNLAGFRVLCRLISLAQLTPPDQSKNVVEDSIAAEIDVLNMSASTRSWQNNFVAASQPAKKETTDCTKASDTISCDANYERYKTAYNKLQAALQDEQKKKSYAVKPQITETATGKRVQKKLDKLARQARTIASQHAPAGQTGHITLSQKAKHELQQAIYGTQADPGAIKYNHIWTNTGTRNTDCSGNKAGTSLSGDIICVCGKDGTQNTDICGTGITDGTTSWTSGGSTAKAAEILAKCAKAEQSELSGANLRQAVATALSLLKETGGAGHKLVLGTEADYNTCKTSADAACVQYGAAVSANKEVKIQPKWADHILEAANVLDTIEKAKERATTERQHLEDLKQRAEALYATLTIPEDTAKRQDQHEGSGIAPVQQNKCKLKNTTAEEYSSEHCDYDSEKKECKTRPGSENPAAGAGNGAMAGAGTTGCSENFNDKEKCEANKRCKWKNNTCKDFSIFVSKKVSLMAAIFMSIV
uniref:Variant surface glycoprotein 356 n=1 Tax=Trypanosoma brucei TaxID=5691 RepID=M4TAB4_9TRYP|nr:variant surface glycoprotein 356 [Trypanosoma brucei]